MEEQWQKVAPAAVGLGEAVTRGYASLSKGSRCAVQVGQSSRQELRNAKKACVHGDVLLSSYVGDKAHSSLVLFVMDET